MNFRNPILFLPIVVVLLSACSLPPTVVNPTIPPDNGHIKIWAVPFVYNFPAGFWSEGTHQYTFSMTQCPNTLPGLPDPGTTWNSSFSVSKSSVLIPGSVYFRFSGLRDGEGKKIDLPIHPLQPTVAYAEWDVKQADINAAKQCKISISWDGNAPQLLMAETPH